MPRYYLYSQIKDDTPLVTFKCEGCGKRVSEKKLFGRVNVIDLKNGKEFSGGKIISMVCSKACSFKVKRRTIEEYKAWSAEQFQEKETPSINLSSTLPQLFRGGGNIKVSCPKGHELSARYGVFKTLSTGKVVKVCVICEYLKGEALRGKVA